MAGSTSKVDWYGKDIQLRAGQAEREYLRALAFQVEGHTKANIVSNDQVDTGFMLNSTYTATDEGSTYRDAGGAMAPEQTAPEGAAAVAVGANYAIFNEMKQSFLYRALEQTRAETDGIIEQVGKRVLGD